MKSNTDLSTREAQFAAAIKNGDKPEAYLLERMENEFGKENGSNRLLEFAANLY